MVNLIEDMTKRHEDQGYHPSFLSWAKSYEHEVELMRELILGYPADVDLLKREYEQLTGKRFRRRNNE